MKLGIDIGSTTIKCLLLDDDKILYHNYVRHKCQINDKLYYLLNDIKDKFKLEEVDIAISGSATLNLANELNIDFIQEVYATKVASKHYLKDVDCIIELGGEDAKILFLSDGTEIRMNGTCAGGTGSFIDQMAELLNVDVEDMNDLAKKHTKTYNIASRCGVFAKSDIQPLINEGVSKADIAYSIFQAVVNQTIGGLAMGREIKGNVIYLGGPLTFNSELRNAFDKTLNLKGLCPEYSLNYVALGSALLANKTYKINDLCQKLIDIKTNKNFKSLNPLFNNQEEYDEFIRRHNKAHINIKNEKNIKEAYLGVDAGSTTLKLVLINNNDEIIYSSYQTNKGNTLNLFKDELIKIYQDNPNIKIKGSCVTGYGENLIKNAFNLDMGVVETMAHLKAAIKFKKDVDFIIDIGGQDIKCFKIKNGSLDNLFLNEACSSGCGSFYQTFAKALGYDVKTFAKMALFAKNPVDLGSRCTVFMNSLVKQAQKDGADINDISAGLVISVIKNALYKVIRTTNPSSLGKNIIAQGGTFYNDAVLRAFENELGINVIRPNIAGLMGAYGSALYAKENFKYSKIINLDELNNFNFKENIVTCGLCNNHCKLTVNIFNDKTKYISGNRCENPINQNTKHNNLNLYEYKRNYINKFKTIKAKRPKIGLPLALNMYEMYPFWHSFFTSLGFEVIISKSPTQSSFNESLNTIPSDTICFPAKLVHSAINSLVKEDVDYIFYPSMTYNIKEDHTSNSYNCPVVAYYPQVIKNNMYFKPILINDNISINNYREFRKHIYHILKNYFSDIKFHEIIKASNKAYEAYQKYHDDIRLEGQRIINESIKDNKQIIVLAGRPYHIDPLINHGIDKLLNSYDVSIISEDALDGDYNPDELKVLNQWSYHSRLYKAAHAIKDYDNMNLVQLVSFGCGVDAITSDEVREILEGHNKIYTQLKIDEITNLGAIKIRLRSLLTAINKEGANNE